MNQKYVVKYGKKFVVLNENLIKAKNLSNKQIERIKDLHLQKMKVFEKMEKTNNSFKLREFNDNLDEIEKELQLAWGFPYNTNYFKFWERPKCSCPKMDNNDRYPSKYYIYNNNCKIHGKIENEK